jgi:hypothetical protein
VELAAVAVPRAVWDEPLVLGPTDHHAGGNGQACGESPSLRGGPYSQQVGFEGRGDELRAREAIRLGFCRGTIRRVIDEGLPLPMEQYVTRLVEEGEPEVVLVTGIEGTAG